MPFDLAFCSRYPFSPQARQYVEQAGLSLTASVVEKAEARLRLALESGRIKKVADLPDAWQEELAVYACARMIASAANNRYLIGRYAVAEAKRAGEYLAIDDSVRQDYVEAVAEGFGIAFQKEGRQYSIPFWQYLAFTPRSYDYKLSNRQLKGGLVKVSRHERLRILEEAVRKRMEATLPIKAEFPAEVKEAAGRLLALLPRLEPISSNVGQENYPPCIRKMIEDLSLSLNLPHTGRVALAIYLVNAGLPQERIVEYFRHAPDFSEKTTTYQIEYIRRRKYSMPSCQTMDSYGLCVADCRCGNPLRFRDRIHGAILRRLEAERKGKE
ncbi:MAG: hypothetical protein N3E51_04210 [Candidatus Micrarchaeota archaeon]|nr:hypothetical protein [Candidatus Micrarchaeota archaeon]